MINTVAIAGNVTRDAELKYTNSGAAVCEVSVAVNDKYKDTDKVYYFDATLFGKFAESVQKYLLKGTPVAITGKLVQDRWEKDGQKRSKVGIVVDQLQMFGRKGQAVTEGDVQQTFVDDVPGDGVPF